MPPGRQKQPWPATSAGVKISHDHLADYKRLYLHQIEVSSSDTKGFQYCMGGFVGIFGLRFFFFRRSGWLSRLFLSHGLCVPL